MAITVASIGYNIRLLCGFTQDTMIVDVPGCVSLRTSVSSAYHQSWTHLLIGIPALVHPEKLQIKYLGRIDELYKRSHYTHIIENDCVNLKILYMRFSVLTTIWNWLGINFITNKHSICEHYMRKAVINTELLRLIILRAGLGQWLLSNSPTVYNADCTSTKLEKRPLFYNIFEMAHCFDEEYWTVN